MGTLAKEEQTLSLWGPGRGEGSRPHGRAKPKAHSPSQRLRDSPAQPRGRRWLELPFSLPLTSTPELLGVPQSQPGKPESSVWAQPAQVAHPYRPAPPNPQSGSLGEACGSSRGAGWGAGAGGGALAFISPLPCPGWEGGEGRNPATPPAQEGRCSPGLPHPRPEVSAPQEGRLGPGTGLPTPRGPGTSERTESCSRWCRWLLPRLVFTGRLETQMRGAVTAAEQRKLCCG